MRFLLFSDLHLDAHFRALEPAAARRRRQSLRDVLARIGERARALEVDALLCGGDLYEHERFTPDTVELVRSTFADLHPIRVLVAPGNHDWLGPESLYRRADFTDNVHVFTDDRLTAVEMDDGLTLWGAAHRAPMGTGSFLRDFTVDGEGVHLALFHGSERGALVWQGDDKLPHAPFSAGDIEASGLAHAFLGHFHRPEDADLFTYPGNPDPLAFGEDGERGIVIADVAGDGTVSRSRESVAVSAVHDLEVDVTGCASGRDVQALVRESVAELDGAVRVTLTGELAAEADVQAGDFTTPANLEMLTVRAGADLRPGYDLEAIGREGTVRGQFVRDVQDDADLDEHDRRAVIITGLRALEGRDDLEVL